MMAFAAYDLAELQGENAGIVIRTQEGTEITIRVERGKTLVLFPFGNVLQSPEIIGHLSTGVLVNPVERKL